jgi:hypothetical protein
MKVLYLASRTDEVTTLELEREITALQRSVHTSLVDAVSFTFLPNVKLEQLAIELVRHRPDVLHISVHGNQSGLWFATEFGKYVELTAGQLIDLLPAEHLPRLILLNACDSEKAAEELSRLPLVAIGSTAPITNQAAIASGMIMYNRLLNGFTIAAAFRAMDATVSSLARKDTALRLCCAHPGLEKQALLRVPQVAARLSSERRPVGRYGVSAYIGLVGCPASTTQVCFFSDDPSFIKEEASLEETQTEVIRDIPRGGEVWTETVWTVDGDFRVAACGITGNGDTFSSSTMLSDALLRYSSLAAAPQSYLSVLPKALQFLRENRGDGFADWNQRVAEADA